MQRAWDTIYESTEQMQGISVIAVVMVRVMEVTGDKDHSITFPLQP